MKSERMIFDFTNENILKMLSVYRTSRTSETNELLNKYKNLRKNVTSKKLIKVENNKALVRFKTGDEDYDCIYYYKAAQDIIEEIKVNGIIDLRGVYIKSDSRIELSSCKLTEIDACYSYWDSAEGVSFNKVTFCAEESKFHFIDFSDGEIYFESVKFEGDEVGFHYANFGKGHLILQQVQYGSTYLSFYNSICDTLIIDSSTISSNINFYFKEINNLCIRSSIIEKTIRIAGIKNVFCLPKTWNIGSLIFYDTENIKYQENRNEIIDAMERFMKNGLDGEFFDLSNQLKLAQFALIKENYHVLGDYKGEDLAYRAYMKYKTSSKWIFRPMKFFKIFGGYGTKPLTIIPAMLAFLVSFAVIYCTLLRDQFILVTDKIGEAVCSVGGFIDALYYSGITFLTIGYGDISPALDGTALRFASVLEGFIGLFLMSYLTVAAARKLLR